MYPQVGLNLSLDLAAPALRRVRTGDAFAVLKAPSRLRARFAKSVPSSVPLLFLLMLSRTGLAVSLIGVSALGTAALPFPGGGVV